MHVIEAEFDNPLYGDEGYTVLEDAVVPVSPNPGYTILEDGTIVIEENAPQLSAPIRLHEAAETLRAALIRSDVSTTIDVLTDTTETGELIDMAYGIFNEALEENGDPYAGDYQRWRYRSWNLRIGYNGTYARFVFSVSYYTSVEQEAELRVLVNQVLAGLHLENMSKLEKATAIHDWIVENVAYDFVHEGIDYYSPQFTAHGALTTHAAVCQGFSSLFYLMCELSGLDCRFIGGYANGFDHAWNIVQMRDGNYYNVDITWDRNLSCDDENRGAYTYTHSDYLLKGSDCFGDHERFNSQNYYSATVLDYDSPEFTARYPMGTGTYTAAIDAQSCANGIHDIVYLPNTAATCTEQGSENARMCTSCGQTWGSVTPALGHNPVTQQGFAPTCTEVGATDSVVCERCGEVLTASNPIPALGHDLRASEDRDATCLEDGYTGGFACARCDYYEAATVVGATGHNLTHYDAKPATCTEPGWKAYSVCSECGLNTREEIPALGHNELVLPAVDATCTEDGITQGRICGTCGEILVAQEVIPATDHVWYRHNGRPSTCTDPGWTDYNQCMLCGVTAGYAVLMPLGHNYQTVAGVDPTCTEPGWSSYEKCSRCNDIQGFRVLPALGHESNSLTIVPAQEPTCTEDGYTESSYCFRCGTVLVQRETVAALGHDLEVIAAHEPTCTEGGYPQHVHCTRCDYGNYSDSPALGHNLVTMPGKAATCTEGGWNEYQVCTRCDYNTYEATEPIAHSYNSFPGKLPTCTEGGWKPYQVCSSCGESSYEAIAATGHDLKTIAGKAATCTEGGWNQHQVCTRCDYSTFEGIAPHGHSFTYHSGIAATCTEDGREPYQECEYCGESTFQAVPASGHTYRVVTGKAATCTEGGWTDYEVCDICGDVNGYEEIPAAGHSYRVVAGKAATCTSRGWTAYEVCDACGDVNGYEEIDATGHNFTTVVTKAKYGANGSEDRVCSVCSAISSSSPIAAPARINITSAASSLVYTGSAIEPSFNVVDNNGRTISSANYTATYSNNVNAGTGQIRVTFRGSSYEGSMIGSFAIAKRSQTLSLATAGRAANYNSVLYKYVDNPITQVVGAKGNVTYSIVDVIGPDGKGVDSEGKDLTKRFTIRDASVGEIGIKNDTDHGDYRVTIRVTSSETQNYAEASVDRTVTIKIAMTAPTLTISKAIRAVNYSETKDRTVRNPITQVDGAKGEITYELVNCVNETTNKVISTFSRYFEMDPSSGEFTVKAGTPRGEYTVGVKVTSGATYNYLSNYKVVGVKIQVL